MNWLLIIVLIEGLLLIIVGSGWIHSVMKDHSAYWKMEKERDEAREQRDALNTENESLHQANKSIVTQSADLHAQNADLREALQEAMAEIKALHMNTIEVPEVAPEQKRPTRKKAETK